MEWRWQQPAIRVGSEKTKKVVISVNNWLGTHKVFIFAPRVKAMAIVSGSYYPFGMLHWLCYMYNYNITVMAKSSRSPEKYISSYWPRD